MKGFFMNVYIKDVLDVIHNKLTIIDKNSKNITLSNGNVYKRKEFNVRRLLAKDILQRIMKDIPPDINVIKNKKELDNIKDRRNKLLKDIEDSTHTYINMLNEIIKMKDMYHRPNDNTKMVTDTNIITNFDRISACRFICGYNHNNDFIMVFYRPGSQFDNSHSTLKEVYKNSTGINLDVTGGGFYTIQKGNNIKSDCVTLFGSSQTYGKFNHEADNIIEYGNKINIKFHISYYIDDEPSADEIRAQYLEDIKKAEAGEDIV